MKLLRIAVFGCAAWAWLFAGGALAQRAEYVKPHALPEDGASYLIDVSLLGTYTRTTDSVQVRGLEQLGTAMLRSRVNLGRTITYSMGLDAALGGSNAGLAYGVTAHLLGLGAHWGTSNLISLSAGTGYDRVKGAVPASFRFPVELSLALNMGSIRPVAWFSAAWVPNDARDEGAALADELEAGLMVRLARQHRYWSRLSAGGGLAIGVVYREFMGTHAIGALLGLNFVGEK